MILHPSIYSMTSKRLEPDRLSLYTLSGLCENVTDTCMPQEQLSYTVPREATER